MPPVPSPPLPGAAAPAGRAPRSATWLKTLHTWHWISSALCLVGMLLFAFTGLTLNHAGQIEAEPRLTRRHLQLPPALRDGLPPDAAEQAAADAGTAPPARPLPPALRDWLETALDRPLRGREAGAEWSPEELYLPLPEPGGDAWLRIDRATGAVEYEHTARGWIALLNDLHKGRHAGTAWRWFIDIFSVACLLFSLTGLLILQHHAARRPTTWPLVGLGLLAPLLLALLFIH